MKTTHTSRPPPISRRNLVVQAREVPYGGTVRFAATVMLAAGSASMLQAGILTVAIIGDPAPDGNGKLNGFGRPSINNAGQVGFTTQNFDTLEDNADRDAMNLGSASGGALLQIARKAQTV